MKEHTKFCAPCMTHKAINWDEPRNSVGRGFYGNVCWTCYLAKNVRRRTAASRGFGEGGLGHTLALHLNLVWRTA